MPLLWPAALEVFLGCPWGSMSWSSQPKVFTILPPAILSIPNTWGFHQNPGTIFQSFDFFLISVPIADSAADDANSVSSLSTIRLSQFWAAWIDSIPKIFPAGFAQWESDRNIQKLYSAELLQVVVHLSADQSGCVLLSFAHDICSSQVVLDPRFCSLAQEGWQSPPRHHYDDMECDSASIIIKCCCEDRYPGNGK